MLNAVRYHGLGVFTLIVHCAHPPTIIVQTVAADSVEYDVPTGSVTLIVCTANDAATNDKSISGWEKPPRETEIAASTAPPHITAAM